MFYKTIALVLRYQLTTTKIITSIMGQQQQAQIETAVAFAEGILENIRFAYFPEFQQLTLNAAPSSQKLPEGECQIDYDIPTKYESPCVWIEVGVSPEKCEELTNKSFDDERFTTPFYGLINTNSKYYNPEITIEDDVNIVRFKFELP